MSKRKEAKERKERKRKFSRSSDKREKKMKQLVAAIESGSAHRVLLALDKKTAKLLEKVGLTADKVYGLPYEKILAIKGIKDFRLSYILQSWTYIGLPSSVHALMVMIERVASEECVRRRWGEYHGVFINSDRRIRVCFIANDGTIRDTDVTHKVTSPL